MATTIGERATQEADAAKARGWFRDTTTIARGLGEYYLANGKLHPLRYERREDRVANHGLRHTPSKQPGGWSHVDTLVWIGPSPSSASHEQEMEGIMQWLQRQIPDLLTWHEPEQEQRYPASDVSVSRLGGFKQNRLWEECIGQSPVPGWPSLSQEP